MDDQTIEKQIQAKGLTAARVTPERINALMTRVSYTSSVVGTSTFVHARLDDRFHLTTGHSACVSPENFNAELGEQIAFRKAKEQARDKLWELEGYCLYQCAAGVRG